MRMKTAFKVSLAALAVAAGFATAAAADSKCSNVNIQVTNKYKDPVTHAKVDIKVVDLEYWDKEDNKWRDEVTDNKRIDFGQTKTWNKNLEYVGGESGVKIKLYFKYDQAGGGWSAEHTTTSSAFTCNDGTSVPVTVE
jgi:hypothetical protein